MQQQSNGPVTEKRKEVAEVSLLFFAPQSGCEKHFVCPIRISGQRINETDASKQKMLLRSPVWLRHSVPTISNKNANVKAKTEARISCYV